METKIVWVVINVEVTVSYPMISLAFHNSLDPSKCSQMVIPFDTARQLHRELGQIIEGYTEPPSSLSRN